jgi:hypothetical protein
VLLLVEFIDSNVQVTSGLDVPCTIHSRVTFVPHCLLNVCPVETLTKNG